jgi:rsbT co-antagonist protein RsbR
MAAHETALFIFSLKDAIVEVLKEEFKYEPSRLFEEAAWICKIMERLSVTSFDSFISGREEIIQGQSEKISELAAPVLRVWEGIVAMPVTGALDPAGARSIMENLLQAIADSGSGIAILDISGVPSVDEAVARHLCDTVTASRLMGAECILSGIGPDAARVMVDLGIDLSNFITKATLASALRFAFGLQGTDTSQAGPPAKT